MLMHDRANKERFEKMKEDMDLALRQGPGYVPDNKEHCVKIAEFEK